MGGGFKKREPIDIKIIRQHPQVMEIFRNHQWLWLFELFKGYDDDIAKEFIVALKSHSEEGSTTRIRGMAITLSPEIIRRDTTLPQ